MSATKHLSPYSDSAAVARRSHCPQKPILKFDIRYQSLIYTSQVMPQYV